jgi:hypothetical protein
MPSTPKPVAFAPAYVPSGMPLNMPLNLGSTNPAIPTLTQEVSARLPQQNTVELDQVFAESSSLMFNPSSHNNPKADAQNRIKAMQAQGIPALEIPTFLRNQAD